MAPIWKLPPHTVHEGGKYAVRAGQIIDWGIGQYGIEGLQELGHDGSSVRAGILDTGLWPGHPDLPEPVKQKDFTGEGNGDGNGHGTHVAGTICCIPNDIGGLGVAPKVELYIARVLGSQGSGSSEGIADGIKWLVDECGCHIINASLGGPPYGKTERNSEYAADNGTILICAAGNSGMGGTDFPANYPTWLPVASHRRDGQLSQFSSRGEVVAVAAPGEEIYSAWIRDSYKTISGTSMASPFATGVIALWLSGRTDYSQTITNSPQLREAIKKFQTDKGPAGHDPGWGDGIIRIQELIDGFRTNLAPGAPL